MLGQPGDQRCLEGIAGAHGIGHLDLGRRDRPVAMLLAEDRRALAATGQEHQLGAALQPTTDQHFGRLPGVQLLKVFVADLDQVGLCGQFIDALAP